MALYVATKNISLTTSTTVLLELASPSTNRIKLVSWWVEFGGTSATAVPINLQIARATATVTGTAYTAVKYDDFAPAANTTVKHTSTSGGTIGDVLEEHQVPPTSGVIVQYPLGREISVPVSGFLWLRAVSPGATVTTTCGLVWEE